eukprot:gene27411-33106_t
MSSPRNRQPKGTETSAMFRSFLSSYLFGEDSDDEASSGDDLGYSSYEIDSVSQRNLKEYDSPFFHLTYPTINKHLVKQYRNEEAKLQKNEFFDAPLLRTNFSNLKECKSYLQALSNCIEVYVTANTETSLQEAVKLGMKALYHGRKDELCFRLLIPSLLLRLGMDQECFDFVWWYAMYGRKFQYDNPNRPFLSLWGNDRGSLVDHSEHATLTFIIADVILKHRLLVLCRQKEAFYTFMLFIIKRYKLQHRGNFKGVSQRISEYIIGDSLKYVTCRNPVLIDRNIYKTMKQGEHLNKFIWQSMANCRSIIGLDAPENPGIANSFREAHYHLDRFKCLLRFIPDTLHYITEFCQREYGDVAKDLPKAVKDKAIDKEHQQQKKKRR